jgi:penicillin V acylase-like amidase (Ntn superfamily)
LDTCATVAEVIASDNKIRISHKAPGLGIHVLVLDKNGDAAVIEFLNGHMKVHAGDELPVAVSTNDTYAKSLQCLRKNSPPVFDQGESISRFIKAVKMTQDSRAETTDELVAFAFHTLAAVSSDRTQWRIVYDNKNMMVHFRTRSNPKIRRVNVSEFDHSKATPVKILDVNANLSGDVTDKFSAYTYIANRAQIGRAYKAYGIPDKQLDAIARFPETFECR